MSPEKADEGRYEVTCEYHAVGYYKTAKEALHAALAFEESDKYEELTKDADDSLDCDIVITDTEATEGDGYHGWSLGEFAEALKAGELS